MMPPHQAGRWERRIVPGPLMLGVAVSFLGCCLAGYYLAHRNVYAPVVRFHLGVLLIWTGEFAKARKELRLARADGPRSIYASQAGRLLAAFGSTGTK